MKYNRKVMLLDTLTDAIAASGAWIGHMSAIEYLEEYYEGFLSLLEDEEISSDYLRMLHDKAFEEKEDIDNWMNDTEVMEFEALDEKYLNEFTKLCHEAINKMGIDL